MTVQEYQLLKGLYWVDRHVCLTCDSTDWQITLAGSVSCQAECQLSTDSGSVLWRDKLYTLNIPWKCFEGQAKQTVFGYWKILETKLLRVFNSC